MRRRPRILFVAFAESVHTARWINQLADTGWDIHLYPSLMGSFIHPELRNTTVHSRLGEPQPRPLGSGTRTHGLHISFRDSSGASRIIQRRWPDYQARQLSRLIHRLKPDIVQSLEFQHAGYLTLSARHLHRGRFPAWIATNWGSDLYLFRWLAEHQDRIRDILATCDFYSCECERDVQIARELGFAGTVLPVMPNAGGINLEAVSWFRQPGPVSARRTIVVKGYQHWAGRALVALRALALCSDLLKGYRVAVYKATPDVAIAAELLSHEAGIPVDMIPDVAHEEMLALFGRSRIYIGLSISDGISTSLLEAIAMGAFPVQSGTACADEWIAHQESGMIVPPEDPDQVAAALRTALTRDDLVDSAAEINQQTCLARLDETVTRQQAYAFYQQVAEHLHLPIPEG